MSKSFHHKFSKGFIISSLISILNSIFMYSIRQRYNFIILYVDIQFSGYYVKLSFSTCILNTLDELTTVLASLMST